MSDIEYCLSEKVMDNADCLNRVFNQQTIPIQLNEKPIIEMFGYFDDVKVEDDVCNWMDEKYRWYKYKFYDTDHIDNFLQERCIPYLYHGTTKEKLKKMIDEEFNAVVVPSIGDLELDMYGEYEEMIPELVYATDHYRMNRVISAIGHRHPKRDYNDIKWFRENGVVLRFESGDMQRVSEFLRSDMEWGLLESDDYVSEDIQIATHTLYPIFVKKLAEMDDLEYNDQVKDILLNNDNWISIKQYLKMR